MQCTSEQQCKRQLEAGSRCREAGAPADEQKPQDTQALYARCPPVPPCAIALCARLGRAAPSCVRLWPARARKLRPPGHLDWGRPGQQEQEHAGAREAALLRVAHAASTARYSCLYKRALLNARPHNIACCHAKENTANCPVKTLAPRKGVSIYSRRPTCFLESRAWGAVRNSGGRAGSPAPKERMVRKQNTQAPTQGAPPTPR